MHCPRLCAKGEVVNASYVSLSTWKHGGLTQTSTVTRGPFPLYMPFLLVQISNICFYPLASFRKASVHLPFPPLEPIYQTFLRAFL